VRLWLLPLERLRLLPPVPQRLVAVLRMVPES
jgi:hypothetical protein